jgi:hypothetical protein
VDQSLNPAQVYENAEFGDIGNPAIHHFVGSQLSKHSPCACRSRFALLFRIGRFYSMPVCIQPL